MLNVCRNCVQTVRSDNGGEYTSNEFKKFCAENGIAHQFTNPYMPEQNGVAERLNRTIIESVRSLLIHSKLPFKFWAEAVATLVYTHNRSPNNAIKNATPYELWFGKRPDISKLRVFGCICYYYVPKELRQKLDSKSKKAVFVGYPDGVKGFKIYDIQDKVFRHSNVVKFDETQFYNFNEEETSTRWDQDKYTIFPDIEDNCLENRNPVQLNATEIPIANPGVETEGNSSDQDIPMQNRAVMNGLENLGNYITVSVDPVGEVVPKRGIPVGVKSTYEETFMDQVNNLGRVRTRKVPPKLRDDESVNLIREQCLMTDSLTFDAEEPQNLKQALESPN